MRLKGILDLLSLKERREFNQIVIWLSVRVVFDIISLASLLPLVLSYFAPEILKESKLWLNILSSMGIKLERTTTALIVFTSLFFLLKFLYFYFIEKKKASFLTRVQHRLVVSVYSRMTDDYSSNTGQLLENTAQLPIKYVFQCLDTILRIIPNSITIMLILVSLVLLQWKIFITICLVFTPMLGLYLLFLRRPIKKVEQSFSQLNPVFFQSITEAFKGRIEIAIFEKLTYFRERVEASSSTLTQSTARLLTLTNSSASFLELIAIVSIGGFFFYVVNAGLTNEESITILSVFILSIVKIIPSLNGIVSATTNLRAYIYTVDILKEVYEKKISDSTKSSFEKQAIFKNRIEIKKVRLNYPKSDFELPEVSVVLEPSDKMAIIGESGSGKSSIIKLILKLVSVSSGYITIDGKAL
ncbi:MAG: ABC transporter ATP-binding protein, partial [Cytophagia bacterium]|nr:ABC transporter ATP-binding protein [Cytophagia bacterium]